MRVKKFLMAMLALCLSIGVLAGCGADAETAYRLPHYDQMGEAGFDPSLFYQNDMTVKGADPSVIYIDDETSEDYGYFYLYPTSDFDFNVGAYSAYRSRNMQNWEFVSAAFVPEKGSFAKTRLYAPEVVHDSETGKYYMFFSAQGYERFGYYFDNNADLAEYKTIKAGIDGTKVDNIQTLKDKIENYKTDFGYGNENIIVPNGYTQEQAEEVIDVLELYAVGSVDENNAILPDNLLLSVLKDTALKLDTVKISKRTGGNEYSLGVAVADNPRGPFVQYTNISGTDGFDVNKREIGLDTPFITHEDFYGNCNDETKAKLQNVMTMIDAHPFEDANGDKYLYFSTTYPTQEYIYGVKIGKSWTDDPEWNTTVPLTRHRYKTVDGDDRTDYQENRSRIDEAPFMYYDADTQKYYLTFSINGCYDKTYSVAQAVGDSPLGPFTKVDKAKGGFVIAADPGWDHVSGPGHHSFIKYNGKLYIAYQGLYNRKYSVNGTQRGVCVDEVRFVTNGDGQKVLYANGPSYAPMPLIGDDAQYANIAEQATVTATNSAGGAAASVLNDGLITYNGYSDIVKEYEANSGKTEIKITFEDYRAVRAIQIFNSKETDKRFEKIDRIELDFTYTDKDGNVIADKAYMKDLQYDFDRYTTHWNGELSDVARPGGSVCVEFDELKVKEIRITLNSDKSVNISEIFVLGK
ncbi:MAG: family 43 glycosylhydrolase [Clostridia bacterium]|nr:family 43 glycosylhydrolase [Clostridia bacterium]